MTYLEKTVEVIREKLQEKKLLDHELAVTARALSPKEAIGNPVRRDFPITEGKELMIEAVFQNCRGQAFTDSPSEFSGTVEKLFSLGYDSNRKRALITAAVNSACAFLGLCDKTVHCKDDEPEKCGIMVCQYAQKNKARTAGLIGLNPALLEALVHSLGCNSVFVTDLNPDQTGKNRFGVNVSDGKHDTEALIDRSDIVFFTGTTIVNGTFDLIWQMIQQKKKKGAVFGVTGAAVCGICGIPRICPCAG